MKRTVIYWKTSDMKRKKEAKAELGITQVSVNGESDYNGDPEKLVPYVEEGLITIRIKEYEQEIRRKKVCFDPIESKPANCKKVGRGSRTRKV
jgi:hypothetical protein